MSRRFSSRHLPLVEPKPGHEIYPALATAPGFVLRNLSALNYSLHHTVWQYCDHGMRLRDMLRPGFLNPHSREIATGDALLAIAADRTVWLAVKRLPNSGVTLTWAR
jgi:hypothetical protein